MRAVVQRISSGKVTVADQTTGAIDRGLLVYLGVGRGDELADARYLADKILNLRIFEDQEEKMNLSLLDVKGKLLVVSQFTLFGDVRKGRRPNFTEAAPPEQAQALYEVFLAICREQQVTVETGVFQAYMLVHNVNDGPITILLDSKKQF